MARARVLSPHLNRDRDEDVEVAGLPPILSFEFWDDGIDRTATTYKLELARRVNEEEAPFNYPDPDEQNGGGGAPYDADDLRDWARARWQERRLINPQWTDEDLIRDAPQLAVNCGVAHQTVLDLGQAADSPYLQAHNRREQVAAWQEEEIARRAAV